jgi:hypothetical protein
MTCCYIGTSSGIFRAVDVKLGLRGKNRYCLVVGTSRCGRDNPASTSGEDALSTGDSSVILALACSPGPQGLPKAPFRLLCGGELNLRIEQPAQAEAKVSAMRNGRFAQREAEGLRYLPGRFAQILVEGSILCSLTGAKAQFAQP